MDTSNATDCKRKRKEKKKIAINCKINYAKEIKRAPWSMHTPINVITYRVLIMIICLSLCSTHDSLHVHVSILRKEILYFSPRVESFLWKIIDLQCIIGIDIIYRMRLTSYFKQRIVTLRDQGFSFTEVGSQLNKENCHTSLSGIKRFVKREREGWFIDKPRTGRAKMLRPCHDEFIDKKIKDDRDIKMTNLRMAFFKEFSALFQVLEQSAERQSECFGKKTTRYCQIVSEKNRGERFVTALLACLTFFSFGFCTFIDESIIEMTWNAPLTYFLFK